MNYLKNFPVNPLHLRDYSRRELVDILDSASTGSKALVLDSNLSGPLSLIAEYNLLKEHGVEKIFHLSRSLSDIECPNIQYFVRPDIKSMRIIADHVKLLLKAPSKRNIFVCFVPWRSTICERALEEEGVIGDIHIGEYHLDFFPLDSDVLSFEINSCFKTLFHDGNLTCLTWIAKSLMKLQLTHGLIPKIIGKGSFSKILVDSVEQLKLQLTPAQISYSGSNIDFLIVLDRNVDLITPLITQLTYEGLLDEIFGIKHSCIELDQSISGSKDKKKFNLNSGDKLFKQIRDSNVSIVGAVLNKNAKDIMKKDEERTQAKSVSQLKEFVSKLGGMLQDKQSLQLHTNITEFINKKILDSDLVKNWEYQQAILDEVETADTWSSVEELIFRKRPIVDVMKHMCLAMMNAHTMKPKQHEQFLQDLCHTYGFGMFSVLDMLSEVGLMKPISSKLNMATLKKNMRLTVENVDEKNPSDISYVYSGYAPLSIRLVESLANELNKKEEHIDVWKSVEDIVKILPGETFELNQGNIRNQKDKKLGIVLFLGGCTFAEISALRYLNQTRDDCEFIVITTDVINGSKLMDSFTSEIDSATAK